MFDPRGNGRSGRPEDPAAYVEDEYAADALAVLDATDTERALLVALSLRGPAALILAAEHPDRVTGLVLVGAALDLGQDASVERQPWPLLRRRRPRRGLAALQRPLLAP